MSESIKVVGEGYAMWVNKNAELHRVNGPAIEWNNGNKEWWIDGKRHRIDGPAIYFKGHEEWWQTGNLHRVDGPAVKAVKSGVDIKQWWLNGHHYYSAEDWFEALDKKNQINYLFKVETR